MSYKEKLTGLLIALAGLLNAHAQQTAFPGALGFGAYATGGRNGVVYHVTNLNDSGAGSFRDAVSHSGRTVVFDVGGTINLLSAVSAQGNLTIAGQTAPGGICLNGGELSFAGRGNVICRYVRVRPGSDTISTGDDCISLYKATNVILDHVSIAFGPWNNIDAVTANNISVQHCIDANPTGQQFGAHTENVGAFWAWQYNIFANSHNRNPLAKINTVFINNLEYNNSAGYTTHTSTRFNHDIVNNYFIAGPASGGNFPWYQIDNNQSMYFTGNLYDSDKNGVLGGSPTVPLPGYQGGGTILSSPWSSWTTVIPTMPTALAYRYDLSTAGAFPRDEVDTLILSQIQTLGSGTTGTGVGTTGPGGGLYTSQTQTGLSNNGYGTVNGLAAIPDADGDGMPDYWELATGSDPNTANPLTNTITGYTLLENYLNFLAAPHAVTQTNTPVIINLTQFTDGFSAGATFTLANATNGTVSLLNGTNAQFTPTANFAGLGGFNFTIHDGGYTLSVSVTVCVTPLAPPVSATQFGGAIIGVSVTSAPPPNNLVWHGDGTANIWDTTTSNWLNNATAAAFKNGDVVTFDDTGFNTPAIALSGTLSPGAILFDDNNNYTLAGSGALSGSGTLSKTGSGTLTIGTVNSSLSGSIVINGGTLALNNGTSIGSGAINLSGGATVSLAGGGTATYLTGPVTVTAGDSATITSGYVANGCSGNFSSGDANSVLNFIGSQSFAGTSGSQFSGFTGTINIVSGSIRFSANSSGNTYGSLSPNFIINGTLQPRNAGNTVVLGALNGSGTLAGPQSNSGAGNTLFNIGGKNTDGTFDGVISSSSAVAGSLVNLVKVGTGTQTLNGHNTFTGTNGVLAGTLLVNGTSQPSLTTVFANATLGGTGVISGPVTVLSGGVLSPGPGGGTGTLTINNNLTLNSSATLAFDLSGSPGGANDLINMPGGLLTLVNPLNFVLNLVNNSLGAGTYTLITGGANTSAAGVGFTSNLPGLTRQTFTFERPASGNGQCYVQLVVGGTAASLLWNGTNGSTWDAGTTVNWLNSGTADVFYNLDTVTFNDTSANGAVSLAAVLQPASLLVDNNSLAYTFSGSGALTGAGPLTKSGGATLTIGTANNSYAGNINVTGGTLAVSSGANLGSGPLTIGNNATLALPGSGSAVYLGNAMSVAAGQTANVTSGVLSSGFSGNFSSGNSASVLNLAGGFSVSGTTPAQFDNFTGTINLQPGATLRFSANSSGNTYGSFNPALVINGTVQPRNAGNTVLLGAFSGSGTLAGAQSAGGSGDTAYVIGGNDSDATFAGVISSNSAVAGSDVSVNKVGAGRLTLSGASTYNGGTTVSAGTLRVINTAGSGTGFGDLEVFAGATLTGSGSIGSATTIDNDAVLAPGDPTGTLTITSSLTLNDNSRLQFSVGTATDLLAVSGDLNLTGELTVTNGPGFGPGSYPLFTCGGALTIGNLTLASAPAGYNYNFDTTTPGVVKLVVSPATPPRFTGTTAGGGNLVLSGANGVPLGNYYVLSATNLTTVSWAIIATNQFDAGGNFMFTNPINPGQPQSFYRIQLP